MAENVEPIGERDYEHSEDVGETVHPDDEGDGTTPT